MNAPTNNILSIEPWWKFWSNPLIVRYIRSRLRLRRSLGWIIGVVILSSFLFFTIYLTAINRGDASPRDAARGVLMPLFIVQSFIMMLMGTGSVASGLVQDRVDGTIDYQRLTPMGPLAKIIGYLFGLPIREYLLFAITLPYTVFALWIGEIPLSVSVPIYTIFFTSVVLYHLTGLSAAMIAKKWRFTTRMTQGLVLLLYLVLPQVSQLGLYAFQYLTVRPVVAAKLLPLLPEGFRAGGDVTLHGVESVPFYIWEFSSFGFSFILQSLLIVTLGLMCYRKWRDSNQHALEKRYGLGMFIAIALMILGNLWPILTRDSQVQVPIFWTVSSDQVDQGLAVVLPLVLSVALLLVGMWILTLVTPTHHEVLRGWRRTVKLGHSHLHIWRDEAPAGRILAVICLVGCLTVFTELWLLDHHRFLESGSISLLDRLMLPLAFVVAISSYYISLIALENRRIFILLMLGWGLPVLVAIFVGAAFSSYEASVYLAALSPFFLIFYGASFLLPQELINQGDPHMFDVTIRAFWIGLVLQGVLIGWMLVRWSRLYRRLVEIAKTGSKDVPIGLMEDDGD